MPVQPESAGSSARYSWAVSPIAAAFTRSGRSLLTRTTLSPSAARLRATERMRVSLSPRRNPAGSTDGAVGVQPAVLDPQVVQVPQGLPGEVAKLRMVPLGFQLGDDHHRQYHPVFGESADGRRVGEQDARVEDVGSAC